MRETDRVRAIAEIEISPPEPGAGPAVLSSTILRQFDITRVGDVTGLDRIGLPVWFACRPNSRSLSVSQGKGIADAQARISAIMEAIEGAVAEQPRQLVSEFGSIAELTQRGQHLVPFESLARTRNDILDRHCQRAWVAGKSVVTGRRVLAPYELVGLDMRTDMPWDRVAFLMSSQGLAAGFSFDSAALHALLELVEHDASFVIDALGPSSGQARRLLCPAGIDVTLDLAMQHLDTAGLRPRFLDVTGHVGIPVVAAFIPRDILSPHGPVTRYSAGIACRLNAAEASAAALLEAVQARLTDIVGARDDLTGERYGVDSEMVRDRGGPQLELADLQSRFPEPSSASGPRWKVVVARMLEAGVKDVFLFPLDSGVDGIHVVRAFATGLAAATGGIEQFSLSSVLSLLGEGKR